MANAIVIIAVLALACLAFRRGRRKGGHCVGCAGKCSGSCHCASSDSSV